MGCSSCQSFSENNKESLEKKFQKSLVLNNLSLFTLLVKSQVKNNPDLNIYTIRILQKHDLTLPALTIIYGRSSFFEYLCRNFNIDFTMIDLSLAALNVTALFIICSRNYLELLQYYLPTYINIRSSTISRSSYSISLIQSNETEIFTTNTPIQVACEFGYIGLLKFVFNFFRDKQRTTPIELDINYVEPVSKLNCALIACKMNNYLMVRFLYNECSANFKILNANHENAIQVACVASKQIQSFGLLDICRFLIETVGIDVTFNYEETLILCEDPDTWDYLQKCLAAKAIFVSKEEFEKNKKNYIQIVGSV